MEIVFEGASRLAGRVTRGEKALSGIFVIASSETPEAGDTRSSTQTDENGQYALEGLADGNYQVQLSGGYRRSFAVSGDTNGDIALPAVSISGVVTEAGSSDPIEGASVQAQSGSETNAFAMKRTVTDSRGYYSIDDLDSAEYQVTARKEGYELKTQPASVGSSSLELNFQLSRGAGLAVRAVDGLTGLPLRVCAPSPIQATVRLHFPEACRSIRRARARSPRSRPESTRCISSRRDTRRVRFPPCRFPPRP